MAGSAIDTVIACQTALLAALDGRDPIGIDTATIALHLALKQVKHDADISDEPDARDKIERALKQTEAARVRVNILTDWTREKIVRLSDIRSGTQAAHYQKPRTSGARPANY